MNGNADDSEGGYWYEAQIVWPVLIEPVHHVRDRAKFRLLRRRMRISGWQGRPLLVEHRRYLRAWTGSHRLAAAIEAGLDRIPVLRIESRDVVSVNVVLRRDWETTGVADLYRGGFFNDEERIDWLEEAARVRPVFRSALELMRAELRERWG